LFRRSKLWSGGQNFDHEIKSLKSIITLLSTFNLMNNLLTSSAIMRSKVFKFIKLHLWLIFSPNYCISHQCMKTFDLIIVKSKKKMLFRLSISWSYWWLKSCSWDWKSKIMFFGLLISWKMLWSGDQNWISWKNDFWSHGCFFNLIKKL
jgi:hypothetical protein